MTILFILGIILFIALIWITIGLFNYMHFLKNIESYQKEYRLLETLEKENEKMEIKSQLFLERMEMERKSPKRYAFMLEFEARHDEFIKEAARSLLLIGPIYWFTQKN